MTATIYTYHFNGQRTALEIIMDILEATFGIVAIVFVLKMLGNMFSNMPKDRNRRGNSVYDDDYNQTEEN